MIREALSSITIAAVCELIVLGLFIFEAMFFLAALEWLR